MIDLKHDLDIDIAMNFEAGIDLTQLYEKLYLEFWDTSIGKKFIDVAGDNADVAFQKLMEIFAQRYSNAPEYPGVLLICRLEDAAADLLQSGFVAPQPIPQVPYEPSAQEKFEALKAQVRKDIGDLRKREIGISSAEIGEKRKSKDYDAAFRAVQMESVAEGYNSKGRDVQMEDVRAARDGKSVSLIVPSEAEASGEIESFAHMMNDHIRDFGTPKPAAGYYTLKVGNKQYKYPVARFLELSELAVQHNLVD